eukprot:6627756-Prymnesium_polylepis.1
MHSCETVAATKRPCWVGAAGTSAASHCWLRPLPHASDHERPAAPRTASARPGVVADDQRQSNRQIYHTSRFRQRSTPDGQAFRQGGESECRGPNTSQAWVGTDRSASGTDSDRAIVRAR